MIIILLVVLMSHKEEKEEKKKTTTDANMPLQRAERQLIEQNLRLGKADRLQVTELLYKAVAKKETRITILAVVKFDNGEVMVVPDMEAFVGSYEQIEAGEFRQLSLDDYSIDLFGSKGESAYQQSMCLINFLTETFYGWTLIVRDVVATCKRPRSFLKQIAHAFDSREKAYKDYRIFVDLQKTDSFRHQPAIEHERHLLYGVRGRSDSDATLGSYSSGIFSRGGGSHTTLSTVVEARPVVVAPTVVTTSQDLTPPASAKESDSDSDSSSGDQILDTSAKEVSAEADESVKLRKQTSSSSLSSSSKSKITFVLPRRAKKQQ